MFHGNILLGPTDDSSAQPLQSSPHNFTDTGAHAHAPAQIHERTHAQAKRRARDARAQTYRCRYMERKIRLDTARGAGLAFLHCLMAYRLQLCTDISGTERLVKWFVAVSLVTLDVIPREEAGHVAAHEFV